MSSQTCKRCNATRTGGFRYCRECGYDFDSESMDAAGAAARAKAKTKAEEAARDAKRGQANRPVRRKVFRSLVILEVVALSVLAGWGLIATATSKGGIASIFMTALPIATATPAIVLPATGFVPTGPTAEAAVERVIDGDTIVVSSGGVELYVRYLGMDAPEAVKLDTPVQFMAPEAALANAQLVSGQTVILERDVSDSDAFGRLLRHVWVDRDGTLFLVGLELVKAGFAKITPIEPDSKYQALYEDAQAQAQSAGLGIWGTPPSPGPKSTLPPTGPTPSLTHFVSLQAVTITTEPQPFRGGIGIYEWSAVTFAGPRAAVRWDVTSTSPEGCAVDWSVQTVGGEPATGTVAINAKARKTGALKIAAPTDIASVTVTSTCTDWLITMRETS